MYLLKADELKIASMNDLKLSNVRLSGNLDLSRYFSDVVGVNIEFSGCEFEQLNLGFLVCEGGVTISNCKIGSIFAMSVFFHGGFSLLNSSVESDSDFSAGGHNRDGKVFQIRNCTFRGFVTFCDDWFEGPVNISNNSFTRGTDLLQDFDRPTVVRFDTEPIIEGNIGDMKKCT